MLRRLGLFLFGAPRGPGFFAKLGWLLRLYLKVGVFLYVAGLVVFLKMWMSDAESSLFDGTLFYSMYFGFGAMLVSLLASTR